MNGILALLALVLVATTTQKEDQVLMEVGKEKLPFQNLQMSLRKITIYKK